MLIIVETNLDGSDPRMVDMMQSRGCARASLSKFRSMYSDKDYFVVQKEWDSEKAFIRAYNDGNVKELFR